MENHVLIGNVTGDLTLRVANTAKGQRNVTEFNLAINGRKGEQTSYYRITVWDKLAELCCQYLHKGSRAAVTGSRVTARAYTNKAGTTSVTMEMAANTVEFLSSSKEPAPARGDADDSEFNKPGYTPVQTDDSMPF